MPEGKFDKNFNPEEEVFQCHYCNKERKGHKFFVLEKKSSSEKVCNYCIQKDADEKTGLFDPNWIEYIRNDFSCFFYQRKETFDDLIKRRKEIKVLLKDSENIPNDKDLLQELGVVSVKIRNHVIEIEGRVRQRNLSLFGYETADELVKNGGHWWG